MNKQYNRLKGRFLSSTTSRLTSPRQNFQLKYTKSISKETKSRLRTAKYNQFERFQLQKHHNDEIKKCNTSCNCEMCGKMSQFQIKIWRQTPTYETAFSRRKRVFKRFRIAGYAAQFLVFYKSEQVKKHKRQKQLQQFLKHPLMNIKRPTIMVQSAHSYRTQNSPKSSEFVIRRNATDCFETDSIKEKIQFNEHLSSVMNCQNSTLKKRQVSLYMERMLRNITTKQNGMFLTPLSIIDKKMKKNKSIPCITHQISPKTSLDNLELEKLLAPFNLLQTHQKKSQISISNLHKEYSQNNKEVVKMIDIMKIKHRQLKRKN